MSYINFNILSSKNLSIYELGTLQLIKQNKTENLSEEINFLVSDTDFIEKMSVLGYIEFIKPKNKSQSKWELIRTTKKGNEVLELIETPEISNDDIRLFEYLENTYKSLGKETGNKRKCKIFISQFRAHSGISRNHLAFLCQSFINDEKEIEYSQKLEYLFFKGAHLFSTKFDLYQSRLYQYYEKHKEFFEQQFLKIKND